jgi:signal transduction histidine kinase
LTISLDTDAEKTLVLYGPEKAIEVVKQFYTRVADKSRLFVDSSGPPAIIQVKEYNEILRDLVRRGIKRQMITEITQDNLQYCKQLIGLIEIRHLQGIKGNFAVSETEYIATAVLNKTVPVTQVIYSNTRPIVEQHQYLFDTLWKSAIPAEQRIREIDFGIKPVETRTTSDPLEIGREIENGILTNDHWYICSSYGGLELGATLCVPSFKIALEKEEDRRRGRIRWITSFDKSGIDLVKMYLDMGISIRHVKNVPLMQFGVGDKKIIATTEQYKGGEMFSTALISNEPDYIKHFNSVFDEVWKSAVDANERIIDLQRGTEPTEIDVIRNAADSVEKALALIKGAKSEILIFFATPNSFKRSMRIGVQHVYNEAAARGVQVRILTPVKQGSTYEAEEAKKVFSQSIVFKTMDQDINAKMPMLIVDRKDILIWELKNDEDEYTVEGSVGTCLHSRSESIISSYVSIFESLWHQTDLYEKLQSHEAIQREFINIAAHELRTPVQPLLGVADLILTNAKDADKIVITRPDLEMIIRNAKRLERLSFGILEASRIETGSLRLHKETIDLGKEIEDVVADAKSFLPAAKQLEIIAQLQQEPLTIEADKPRLFEVISNLVHNAIKFTESGKIIVKAEKQGDRAIVSVRDSGTGVDPDVKPRLFTKFASKSEKGTGLGLYISKNIVEAHGGRIWAENNKDGTGATFSFSLPVDS